MILAVSERRSCDTMAVCQWGDPDNSLEADLDRIEKSAKVCLAKKSETNGYEGVGWLRSTDEGVNTISAWREGG